MDGEKSAIHCSASSPSCSGHNPQISNVDNPNLSSSQNGFLFQYHNTKITYTCEKVDVYSVRTTACSEVQAVIWFNPIVHQRMEHENAVGQNLNHALVSGTRLCLGASFRIEQALPDQTTDVEESLSVLPTGDVSGLGLNNCLRGVPTVGLSMEIPGGEFPVGVVACGAKMKSKIVGQTYDNTGLESYVQGSCAAILPPPAPCIGGDSKQSSSVGV